MTRRKKAKSRPTEAAPLQRGVTTIDRVLGQRVRVRRLELGISQERLADSLGVTFQQVQKYEKGVNRIAASRLLQISTALEHPIGSFFVGMGPAEQSLCGLDAVEESLSTPDGVRLMALFATIKAPAVRRRVLALTQALADESD